MKALAYYARICFLIVSRYLMGYFALWVLFHSIPQLVGWRYDELVFAIVLLIISSASLDILWSIASTLSFIVLLASASFIMTDLLIIAASSAFWIVTSFRLLSFFFPSRAIIRPADSGWEIWLTPVFGAVSFALAYLVWSKGTRSYAGTGS